MRLTIKQLAMIHRHASHTPDELEVAKVLLVAHA